MHGSGLRHLVCWLLTALQSNVFCAAVWCVFMFQHAPMVNLTWHEYLLLYLAHIIDMLRAYLKCIILKATLRDARTILEFCRMPRSHDSIN